jgi:hypothetical protein
MNLVAQEYAAPRSDRRGVGPASAPRSALGVAALWRVRSECLSLAPSMTRYQLVVSDPPQQGANADEAARHLGLTPEQFLGKVSYPIPEIWFAHPDDARVRETAAALHEAGCRVRVMAAEALARIPSRRRVRAFSFDASGFVAHLDDGDVTVAYDGPVVAVFCRPRELGAERAAGPRPRRGGLFSYKDRLLESGHAVVAVEDGDDVPFLDFYVGTNGAAQRLTVLQNAVSFAGLGRMQPRAASNMEALVGSCEDRFGHGRVDRRLVGMRLRARGSIRPPGSEHRRGFSFASPGLSALLAAVADSLDALSQPELSARLAFLTRRTAV